MTEQIISFYREFKDDVIQGSIKHVIHCLDYRNEKDLKEYYLSLPREEQLKIASYWNDYDGGK